MTRRKTGSGIRMKERLQKLLSAAGVCSRRAAEGYITAGRVTVNGETALLGQQADRRRMTSGWTAFLWDGNRRQCT